MVLPALAVPVLGWSALAAGGAAGTTALIGTNDDWKKGLRLDPAARIKNEEFDRTTGQIKDYSFMDYLGSSLLGQDLRQLNEAAQKKSDSDLVNNIYGEEVSGLRQGMAAMGIADADLLTPGKRQSATDFGAHLASQTAILNRLRQAKIDGVPNEQLSLITKDGMPTLDEVDSVVNAWERDPRNITSATNTAQRDIDAREAADKRTARIDSNNEKQQNFNNSIVQSDREYRRWKEGEDDKWRRYQLDKDQADRALARRDRKDELLMTMQQRTLDRNFERERADRADARADRDKRTAMLMQMVQGLSKLGYGMAI